MNLTIEKLVRVIFVTRGMRVIRCDRRSSDEGCVTLTCETQVDCVSDGFGVGRFQLKENPGLGTNESLFMSLTKAITVRR